MTAEEKKTIDMIRQLREAVENGALPIEQFPAADLKNLVDATLGREFLGITGGMKKKDFEPLINSLLRLLEHSVQEKDGAGCVKALMLLEEQYRCFDGVLTAYQAQKYIEQYKIMAILAGEGYSRLQYSRHQENRPPEERRSGALQSGRGVVYTSTLGSTASLQQPEYIHMNWDYICFTADKDKWGTKNGAWEYRQMEGSASEAGNMLLNRYILKPHEILPEYDFSIWVDPVYKITGDLELFLTSYGRDSSLLTFSSYMEDDLYEIMKTGLHSDDENIMVRKKCLQYEKEGYPRHNGVINRSIIARNHRDEKMRQVMETWWTEAVECGKLWNVGFNYAAWKHNYDYAICDSFVEMNSYFKNMVCDLEVVRND